MRTYDHVGIPTTTPKEGEVYNDGMKVWLTDFSKSPNRIEWLRFEPGSWMPELIQTTTHLAYQVTDPEAEMQGKKVLLVDTDPQASLTVALGYPRPDELPFTLSDAMEKIMMEQPFAPGEGLLHHPEGVDLMPANIMLSGLEVSLVNAMNREKILKQYLDTVRREYDFILLDCMPSLGMLTVNALAAADQVLIPVQAQYLSAKGLEQLLQTISKVRRQINPKLKIEGILLTMVDSRTNYAKEISALIREAYGNNIKVFSTDIPRSVRAAEISAEGKSIFQHDPKGKVAEAYRVLTKEVLSDAEKRRKRQLEHLR